MRLDDFGISRSVLNLTSEISQQLRRDMELMTGSLIPSEMQHLREDMERLTKPLVTSEFQRLNEDMESVIKPVVAANLHLRDDMKDVMGLDASSETLARELGGLSSRTAETERIQNSLEQTRALLGTSNAALAQIERHKEALAAAGLGIDRSNPSEALAAQVSGLSSGLDSYLRAAQGLGVSRLFDESAHTRELVTGFALDPSTQGVLEEVSSALGRPSFLDKEARHEMGLWSNEFQRLAGITEKYANLDSAEIRVEGDRLIVGSDSVTQEDLRAFLGRLSDELPEQSGSWPLDILRWLVGTVKNIKNMALQKAVIDRLENFFVSIATSLIAAFVFAEISKSGQKPVVAVQKFIIHNVQESQIPLEAMRPFRLVCAERLNVRAKKSRKSEVLSTLYLGQTVEVVEKKRNWTLVRWNDRNGQLVVQGWVFSRYLAKIGPKGCKR